MATGTAVDVVMPQMGVSVSEGTITKWLKAEGEPSQADEALLEISTDKVDTEVPSPAAGVVQQILAQEGETVDVGTTIALIAPEGAAAAPLRPLRAPSRAQPREAPARPPSPQPVPSRAARRTEPPTAPAARRQARPAGRRRQRQAERRARFVSPVVARIAAEHGVDVVAVPGTGRGGRVTKKDILEFIEARARRGRARPERPPRRRRRRRRSQPPPRRSQLRRRRRPAPPRRPRRPPRQGETVEPMTPMRKGIAEHMRRSLDTSAHVTTVFEVDMSKVVCDPRRAEGGVRGAPRRQADLPRVRRARGRRGARDWPWLNARDPRRLRSS